MRGVGLLHLALSCAAAWTCLSCDVFVDRRIVGNEAATRGNLQRVRALLLEYQRACRGFPSTLSVLYEPAAQTLSCTGPVHLDAGAGGMSGEELLRAVTSRPVSGYRFVYVPVDRLEDNVPAIFLHFEMHASPTEAGVNGRTRFVATDVGDVRSEIEK